MITLRALSESLGVSRQVLLTHIRLGNLKAIDVGTGSRHLYRVPDEEAARVMTEGLKPRQVAAEAPGQGRTMGDVYAKWGW